MISFMQLVVTTFICFLSALTLWLTGSVVVALFVSMCLAGMIAWMSDSAHKEER